MHAFDFPPGLDPERVEAQWDALGVEFRVEFFALLHDLSENGPGDHAPCPGEPIDGFLVVYAIPIPCYPGQRLRVAYDLHWNGFWYLGLGPERPPCRVAASEAATLLLGSD